MVSRWENARYLRASYPVIEHIVAVCRALSSIGFPVAHYGTAVALDPDLRSLSSLLPPIIDHVGLPSSSS
jgi:uncharacterized protein involved in propanediol utilization